MFKSHYTVSNIKDSSQSPLRSSHLFSYDSFNLKGCTVDHTSLLFWQSLRISLQRHLKLASPDFVNFYLYEAVPSTTLWTVLFLQFLRTSQLRREFQTSSETVFNGSQNLYLGSSMSISTSLSSFERGL